MRPKKIQEKLCAVYADGKFVFASSVPDPEAALSQCLQECEFPEGGFTVFETREVEPSSVVFRERHD